MIDIGNRRVRIVILLGVPLIELLLTLAIAIYTGYPLRNNDFLENHYLAMYVINFFTLAIMFGALVVYLRRSPLALTFSIICILLVPRLLRFITTPIPYAAATSLLTAGAVLIMSVVFPLHATERTPRHLAGVIGGMLLGAAALFRYHVLVGSVFFIISVLIFAQRREFVLSAGLALLAMYSPQFLVNHMTCHGLLETANALSICNLVHGVDWFHIEKQLPIPHPWHVINGSPLIFARKYLVGVFDIAKFTLPLPLCIYFASTPESKKRAYALTLFSSMYLIFFGISASPCAPLLLIPISIISFGTMFSSPGIPTTVRKVLIALIFAFSAQFVIDNVRATVAARPSTKPAWKSNSCSFQRGLQMRKRFFRQIMRCTSSSFSISSALQWRPGKDKCIWILNFIRNCL